MATGTVRTDVTTEALGPRAAQILSSVGPTASLRFEPTAQPPPHNGPPTGSDLAGHASVAAGRAKEGHASVAWRVREDDTRKTAWEASHLDLSDVMSSGPLVLRNLFATGTCSAVASGPRSVESSMRTRFAPLGVAPPTRLGLPSLGDPISPPPRKPRFQKPYTITCLLYTSPSPRDTERSRMPSSA